MPRVKVPIAVQTAATSDQPTEVVAAVAQALEPVEQPTSKPQKRFTTQQIIFGLAGLLFLILIALLINIMSDRNKLQTQVNKLATNPAISSKVELQRIVDQVGLSFQLPTGETPTLITVADAASAKSKNPIFFKDAQNGDKVLLYSNAGEAILYRPSTKKIIAVAPVNLNGNDATSTTNSPTSK